VKRENVEFEAKSRIQEIMQKYVGSEKKSESVHEYEKEAFWK
jgi:hypothetical protein